MTQATTNNNKGMATTTPIHGLSPPSSIAAEMGVIRKKFNNRGRGLHDD